MDPNEKQAYRTIKESVYEPVDSLVDECTNVVQRKCRFTSRDKRRAYPISTLQ